MNANSDANRERMQRVLDHIDGNLDGDLDLETVSAIAGTSKFHFHRQFAATFNLSPRGYVRRARMNRASHQLIAEKASITEIALDAGYQAPDAFARAFRRWSGQTPSASRKSPDWAPWLATLGSLGNARRKLLESTFSFDDIPVREIEPTRVAIMEHRGDPAGIRDTARRFHAWRKANKVSPVTNASFTVFRSRSESAAPSEYAMDICVACDRPIGTEDGEVKAGVIPGGRYAVMPVDGSSNNHRPAAAFLLREWLPASGEEAGDFPLYCKRQLLLSADAKNQEVFGELYLLLRPA